MVLFEAVLEGALAGLAGGPGSNGEEVKVSKIPAELTGRDHDDWLPANLAQRADH